jgi:hypothetical protein
VSLPDRLSVKVLARAANAEPREVVAVFHRWIQQQKLDERLIDVTDYSHVHHGPGVVLIAHAANYALDGSDGVPGLLYARKRDGAGTAGERLVDAFRRALAACKQLEGEPQLAGKLAFDGGRVRFRINDRLLAPPGDESFAVWRPELDALCARLYGDAQFALAPSSDTRVPFTVGIEAKGARVAELLARI